MAAATTYSVDSSEPAPPGMDARANGRRDGREQAMQDSDFAGGLARFGLGEGRTDFAGGIARFTLGARESVR